MKAPRGERIHPDIGEEAGRTRQGSRNRVLGREQRYLLGRFGIASSLPCSKGLFTENRMDAFPGGAFHSRVLDLRGRSRIGRGHENERGNFSGGNGATGLLEMWVRTRPST